MSVKRYQPVAQCVEPSYQAQMIEPKLMEFSEGEYVLHSDYARLEAEVERLTEVIRREVDGGVDLREEAQRTVEENHNLRAEVERLTENTDKLCKHGDLEIERLKAEVERLRKAGDMLAFALAHGDRMEYGCVSDPIEEYLDRKEIKEWNDAWEGKQS